jgi:hypothetical protein
MAIALSHSRAAADRPAGAGRRRGAVGRRAGALLVLVLAGLSLLTGAARADVGEKIIERCTHGQSISGFSQQAYRRALQELPTEVEEYSDCANLIRRAQLAAAGGGAGAGAGALEGAGALPLSPTERAALSRVPHRGAAPMRVDGSVIQPGVVHTSVASALSTLPTPLLAVLALLLACAVGVAGRSIRGRVLARRAR